jgi:hypothetical protein
VICLRCRAEWRVGSTGKRVESVGRVGEVIEGRCSLRSPEETKERARLTLFKQARNKQARNKQGLQACEFAWLPCITGTASPGECPIEGARISMVKGGLRDKTVK